TQSHCTMQWHKWLTTCTGGFAPKQGCFGCLSKVLHDAKPAEQATLDTPFFNKLDVFRRLGGYL
ncbi:MAG: hypothetical protein ACLRO6_06985, partial [[Eubacterium] siraeum]